MKTEKETVEKLCNVCCEMIEKSTITSDKNFWLINDKYVKAIMPLLWSLGYWEHGSIKDKNGVQE